MMEKMESPHLTSNNLSVANFYFNILDFGEFPLEFQRINGHNQKQRWSKHASIQLLIYVPIGASKFLENSIDETL